MSNKIDAVTAAEILKQHDNYVILTHMSPDGDTLGSAFALREALCLAGKNATVLCPDKYPGKFGYLVREPKEEFVPQTVVAVDVADDKLLGNLRESYLGKILLCIDHHSTNNEYAENLYLEGDSAAACECVFNVIKALGTKITPYIASCLYTGIATDTGCFKFTSTSARTHRIAAELIELGADYGEINRVMFDTKTYSVIKLEKAVYDSLETDFNGKLAIVTVTADMLENSGCEQSDLDGIAAIPRQIEGVTVGVTVKEREAGHYKVSVRTHEPIDASAICAAFGGGGHVRAGGCEFFCSHDEVIARLKAEIKKVL